MIAQEIAKHNGNVPVYRYRFDQLPHNTSSLAKGITTGLEQNYVFSNLVADFAWDQALAREITSAWVSFAYSLDPNPGQGTTNSRKPEDYDKLTDRRLDVAILAWIQARGSEHCVQCVRFNYRDG